MTFYAFDWGGARCHMVARDEAAFTASKRNLEKQAPVSNVEATPLTHAADYWGPVVQGWIRAARLRGCVWALGMTAATF